MSEINFAPHVLVHSAAMGANICQYCGLAEDYLRKGSLSGGWPYGGRWLTKEGDWAMQCRYWPALADRFTEIEEQLVFQSGVERR